MKLMNNSDRVIRRLLHPAAWRNRRHLHACLYHGKLSINI